MKRQPSSYPPQNSETIPTSIHPPDETKNLRLSTPETKNYSNIRYTHQMKRKPSDYPPLNLETFPTSDTPTR